MDVLKAMILGILQGATEFLPVSSSGHLVLVPWWFGWDNPPTVFDVTVHMGTLVAVLLYFWRDWLALMRAGWFALRNKSIQDPQARLLLLLVLGTIPAGVAGLLLEDYFESIFSEPPIVAVFLLVTALLLTLSERASRGGKSLSELTVRDALAIGLAQALAILPGISRSGSTIAMGLWRGLPRATAARYSFMLATPVIMAAGLKQLLDVIVSGEAVGDSMALPLLVGFVAAVGVGYLCVWSLLRLLQRIRLYGFAIYCAVFGTLSLLVALFS